MYKYVHTCMHIYIYIYICIERARDTCRHNTSINHTQTNKLRGGPTGGLRRAGSRHPATTITITIITITITITMYITIIITSINSVKKDPTGGLRRAGSGADRAEAHAPLR